MNPRELLRNSFQAALAAADPLQIVPSHLPRPPKGKTLVVGAGKAAAAMAHAVETHWPPDAQLSGIVITRYDHSLPTDKIEVIEAGHPLPDQHGELATRTMLEKVQTLNADDLLLGLFSGGGSSLLSLPIAGVPMEALRISVGNAERRFDPGNQYGAQHLPCSVADWLPPAARRFIA